MSNEVLGYWNTPKLLRARKNGRNKDNSCGAEGHRV